MFWFWFSVVIILILSVLAIIWAARVRKQRLERKLRLEIANQGNVESHFQIRVEELTDQLKFQFSCAGTRLPEVIELNPADQSAYRQMPPAQATPARSGINATQKVQSAMNKSYTIASILTSLGSILPRSIGAPLSQAGSQLHRGQAQATRVQQVSNQAASLAPASHSNSPAVAQTAQIPAADGPVNGLTWIETPAIEPGQLLCVDLWVRSAWMAGDAIRSFQIKSRPTEGGQAKMVVEDGQVEIRGGFWSHRLYPILLIIAVAIMAFLLAIWLARLNGLPI